MMMTIWEFRQWVEGMPLWVLIFPAGMAVLGVLFLQYYESLCSEGDHYFKKGIEGAKKEEDENV